MPTYQYQCKSCGGDLEVVQKFSDASLTVCPECSGELRKVFAPVGVVFKGSGFYRTDSREAGKSSSTGSFFSSAARDPGRPSGRASTSLGLRGITTSRVSTSTCCTSSWSTRRVSIRPMCR